MLVLLLKSDNNNTNDIYMHTHAYTYITVVETTILIIMSLNNIEVSHNQASLRNQLSMTRCTFV